MKYIHMKKYAGAKTKLLAEIDSLIDFNVWSPSGELINMERLKEACSYERIQEGFEYTMMCFRESLRIESPVNFTTSHMCTRDIVLAANTPKELKINAGQRIHIGNNLLHHKEEYWGANHFDYIPERFDSTSEHYKKPDGTPRSHYAFAPFLGGQRICLGKTFAETVAKKLISMILKFYTLELCDERLKEKVHLYDFFQMRPPVFKFKFQKRILK